MKKALFGVALFLLSSLIYGYTIKGERWPYPTTLIYTGINGSAPSGVRWRDAVQDAAAQWSDSTSFEFQISNDYKDPCDGSSDLGPNFSSGDGLNGMDFTSSICGEGFEDYVLAVTRIFYSHEFGSLNVEITEADVLFNDSVNWDVYDTKPNFTPLDLIDFRRVALHELGHAIGMRHAEEGLSTFNYDDCLRAGDCPIMVPTVSNNFALQSDDINGVNDLYSGYQSCPYTEVGFGSLNGELATGDCTVRELAGGANDDSFVDVYQLDLDQDTTLNLTMRAPSLDSVLLLMDVDSQIFAADDDSAGGCDAQLSESLSAGRYVILANTFTEATECGGTEGSYRLDIGFELPSQPMLSNETSLLGGVSSASFTGGVTINRGQTYVNAVTSDDTFDVLGNIAVDPAHIGQPGFLVIAAIMEDGQILLKNEFGDFLPIGAGGITAAQRKTLASQEALDILLNITPSALGINEIELGFLIGYGLDAQPNEVYFHETPISLVVQP
ncbi:MAG: matrixin family metalloprotease [Pseudohongiellaceae bacterium]|nr:matrixin family metalloprotease [Pseudohongiellaceae bacterium]